VDDGDRRSEASWPRRRCGYHGLDRTLHPRGLAHQASRPAREAMFVNEVSLGKASREVLRRSAATRRRLREEALRPYTARLQKGGALVAEMRQLLLVWDGTPGCAERIVRTNVVSAPSRARALDIVTRTFVPRFVASQPPD